MCVCASARGNSTFLVFEIRVVPVHLKTSGGVRFEGSLKLARTRVCACVSSPELDPRAAPSCLITSMWIMVWSREGEQAVLVLVRSIGTREAVCVRLWRQRGRLRERQRELTGPVASCTRPEPGGRVGWVGGWLGIINNTRRSGTPSTHTHTHDAHLLLSLGELDAGVVDQRHELLVVQAHGSGRGLELSLERELVLRKTLSKFPSSVKSRN